MSLLLLVLAFGPGSSGGNPLMTIASPARDYLFAASAPTAQVFGKDGEEFDFGLAGYRLELREIPYDPAACPAANAVKTVCAKADATVVVLSGHKTFRLKFTDTGIGAARLRAISDEIVATFSQGSKPRGGAQ